MNIALLLVIGLTALVYLRLAARRTPGGIAPSIFVVLQLPFLTATIWKIQPGSEVEVQYGIFLMTAFVAFVGGAIIARQVWRRGFTSERQLTGLRKLDGLQWQVLVVGVAACLVVGVVFMRRVGYNAFLRSAFSNDGRHFVTFGLAPSARSMLRPAMPYNSSAYSCRPLRSAFSWLVADSGGCWRSYRLAGIALLVAAAIFYDHRRSCVRRRELTARRHCVHPRFGHGALARSWRSR